MWLMNSSQVAVDQYPAAPRGVRNSAAAAGGGGSRRRQQQEAAAAGGGGGSMWKNAETVQAATAKAVLRGPLALVLNRIKTEYMCRGDAVERTVRSFGWLCRGIST